MKRQDDMDNVMLGASGITNARLNTHSLRPHPPACKRLRTKKPQSAKRNMKTNEMRVESSNMPICTECFKFFSMCERTTFHLGRVDGPQLFIFEMFVCSATKCKRN